MAQGFQPDSGEGSGSSNAGEAVGSLAAALEGARGFNVSVAQALTDIGTMLDKTVNSLKLESVLADKKLEGTRDGALRAIDAAKLAAIEAVKGAAPAAAADTYRPSQANAASRYDQG